MYKRQGYNRAVFEIDLNTSTVTNTDRKIQIIISKATDTTNRVIVDCYALFPYKRNNDTPQDIIFPFEICRSTLHNVKVEYPSSRFINDSLLPSEDGLFDIGSPSLRVRNIHLAGRLKLPDSNDIWVEREESNFPWSGAPDAVRIGHRGPGTTLVIEDIDGARWAIGMGGYDFTIAKHKADTNSWETALIIHGDGANNAPQLIEVFTPIRPASDNSLDIGTPSLRFRNIYCVNLYAHDIKLKYGWTIFEEEDGLYLKNEFTGKVYKIKLEEVN